MDKAVLDKLADKGIVTVVGLEADKVTDVNNLINRGFATSVDTEDVYASITATPETVDEPVEVVVDDDVEDEE
jgi:hypothetical protein